MPSLHTLSSSGTLHISPSLSPPSLPSLRYDLLNGRITLETFRGVVFCGGFSYADVNDSAKVEEDNHTHNHNHTQPTCTVITHLIIPPPPPSFLSPSLSLCCAVPGLGGLDPLQRVPDGAVQRVQRPTRHLLPRHMQRMPADGVAGVGAVPAARVGGRAPPSAAAAVRAQRVGQIRVAVVHRAGDLA